MPGIIFVRHASPQQDPAIPTCEWRLTDAGREAARRLGERLADMPLDGIVTSDEVKAIETGRCVGEAAGIESRVDARLREVERPYLESGFEEAVIAYLGGAGLPGWEPIAEVVERLTVALAEVPRDSRTAVVTHGTALTVYLRSITTLDPVRFWRELELPDAWAVVDGRPQRLDVFGPRP